MDRIGMTIFHPKSSLKNLFYETMKSRNSNRKTVGVLQFSGRTFHEKGVCTFALETRLIVETIIRNVSGRFLVRHEYEILDLED